MLGGYASQLWAYRTYPQKWNASGFLAFGFWELWNSSRGRRMSRCNSRNGSLGQSRCPTGAPTDNDHSRRPLSRDENRSRSSRVSSERLRLLSIKRDKKRPGYASMPGLKRGVLCVQPDDAFGAGSFPWGAGLARLRHGLSASSAFIVMESPTLVPTRPFRGFYAGRDCLDCLTVWSAPLTVDSLQVGN
jgi:hypothetical protein